MVGDTTQVKHILDLGCGTGNISELLCRAFPNSQIEGLDSSVQMIGRALKDREKSEFKERLSYRVGSVENEATFKNKKHDLVFSNATLHWCTGHAQLLPDIINKMVRPNGGVLAIQVPDTRQQISHVLMDTASFRSGMLDKIRHVRIPQIEHDAAWYYNLLSPLVKEIDMWTTEYVQQLPSPPPHMLSQAHNQSQYLYEGQGPGLESEQVPSQQITPLQQQQQQRQVYHHPVLEYTKATGLLPIIEALGGEGTEQCQAYLDEYDRLLHEAYPILKVSHQSPDNTDITASAEKHITLMPFKRMFILCKM